MTKKTLIIFLCLILSPFSLLPLGTAAQEIDPLFNPNRIIEDSDLLNYDSMSLSDIQNFLISKNSFLANYSTFNAHGDLKSAAEIIYDASHKNYDCGGVTLSDTPTEYEKQQKCRTITTVNPKFLLVLLQKEASLIEDSNPPQARLDWATGYGCPDGWVCNPYYKGFGKQVNSASLQFISYINEQSNYTYKAGNTYTFTNPYGTISKELMTVTPQNKATAALYNYTPHVFNGNYNVYKLWKRYFPKGQVFLYPDGSILQAKNEAGVWLISGGKKRPFLNYSSFISRFRPDQIITVLKDDLNNYPLGEAIKFPNYSLVQTPDKKIYLLVNKEKRPFASLAVFKKIGFNTEEIEKASVEDLANYQTGATITATSTYVTGILMQDKKGGPIYYVENGVGRLVDKILLTTKLKNKKITKVSSVEIKKYATSTPLLFDEGTLVKTENFPTVYLISNGLKRPFADEATFTKLGYNLKNVITASSQFLYNYNMGETIKNN